MDPFSIADDDPDRVAAQDDGYHKGLGRSQVQMIVSVRSRHADEADDLC